MKTLLQICCVALLPLGFASGQPQDKGAEYETPVALIEDIYNVVSARDSESVDWDKVKSMFIDEAVIVLRTSRDKTSQFTVEEFIQDFRDFYQSPAVITHGFEEKIISMKTMVYKDIAFIATVYSAAVKGSDNPPHQGIDMWLLKKTEGYWKITSVVNEVIPKGEELPDLPEWKFGKE